MPNRWNYTKGLQSLGNGCYAYLQPDGSWGWSNAGLIADRGESLLVDTLFDLKLTREMLDAMRRAEPQSASRIGTLVNTHSNGDHCFGNELVKGAEIVASVACAEEMARDGGAGRLAEFKRNAAAMGEAGAFFAEIFAPFDFEGINLAMPTTTFERQMGLHVGNKSVRLIEVGPAHTRGDVLVQVVDDRVIYTGDILFVEGHPIIWAGAGGELDQRLPVDNRFGRRCRRTRPRTDYRQTRRRRDARLSRIRRARGTPALRRRNAVFRRGAGHLAG